MCLSQLLYVSVGTSQVSRTQFPYMGQHSSRMFFPHAFARQTPTLPQNPARPPPPGSVPRPPALSPPWSGVLPPSTPAESAALPSSQCILGVSLCLCLLTEEEFLGSSKHGCSVVPNSVSPGTAASQAPLSMGLQARILEWLAMPSSRGLPNPQMELVSFMSPALTGRFPLAPPGKPHLKAGMMPVHLGILSAHIMPGTFFLEVNRFREWYRGCMATSLSFLV